MSSPGMPGAPSAEADAGLYFGIIGLFAVALPLALCLWRLFTRPREGLAAMWSPPYDLDPSKRRLSSRVRSLLFQRTTWGFYLDVLQAVLSALSCVLFIAVSFMGEEPLWITDVEDAFTLYFLIDYGVRLWLAQDTLSWYFSLSSGLDFITTVPALTVWLIQEGNTFDTNVAAIVQSTRAFRVFRMFRVIRVIRLLSLSPSYAFQRQVLVLATTVLSLIFVAAGLYQITEGGAVKSFPYWKAMYYATITVIGRPGVPVDSLATAIFLIVTCLLAATIIPTFVAELIRLWFDNASLEVFRGNPEAPHVIIAGDTNVSRLRALAEQYFHAGRDPDSQAPLVILAEAKPEGALRNFLDAYKFSGLVRYVRGSARRAADLRRADVGGARACVMLNYVAGREAGAADNEVLAGVMAVKSLAPLTRVLAQLHRPRKRNHLKAVPGWQDGDKSVSAVALGMTLMGLAVRIPGVATLVTNLVRRGTSLAGLPDRSLAGRALPWWRLLLHGESGKAAALATLSRTEEATALGDGVRAATRTPLEEYAASLDATLHELPVHAALEGLSFGAAARMAFLRYGLTLVGATLPVNDDVFAHVPGLPRTYRLVLFPAEVRMRAGMKLYAISADAAAVERFRIETGGAVVSALERVVDTVGSAFVFGNSASGAPPVGAQQLHEGSEGDGFSVGAAGAASMAAAAGASLAPGAAAALPGAAIGGGQYRHNAVAVGDLSQPWCFCELDDIAAAEAALVHRLHLDAVGREVSAAIPAFNRFGQRVHGGGGGGSGVDGRGCPTCRQAPTRHMPLSLLQGQGVCVLGSAIGASEEVAAAVEAAPASPPGVAAPSSADFSFGDADDSAQAAVVPSADAADVLFPPAPTAPLVVPRRTSLGDDGLGAIDDTDDIQGPRGPLLTQAPTNTANFGIAATARLASRANTNALAVRLALPVTAVTDVESLAADALDTAATNAYHGHVLVCGANESMGFLLRAVASLAGERAAGVSTLDYGVAGSSGAAAAATADEEGDQYTVARGDIVVLAPTRPSDAALNALYPGSGRLLSRLTFLQGNPAEAADLLRAGVQTARAAVVLTGSKPAATADGSDNLSDDSEAIVVSAIIGKLAPGLHVVTELLHASHAPHLRPVGSGLNDAQRGALIGILEERESSRQRSRLEASIRLVAAEREIRGSGGSRDAGATQAGAAVGGGTVRVLAPGVIALPPGVSRTDILLSKLTKQRLRLRAAMTGSPLLFAPVGAGAASAAMGVGPSTSAAWAAAPAGAPALGALSSAVEALDRARGAAPGGVGRGVTAAELEHIAETGLSNSAIVDVLVGVREDFSASAGVSAGGSEAAGGGLGGGSGGGGAGASKGSGATNELFGSPAFAAGRVFSFATLDAIVCEALFEGFVIGVVKQLTRAARRQRLVALPMTEALVMCRLLANGATPVDATPAAVTALRREYLSELAAGVIGAARGTGAFAPAAPPAHAQADRPRTYGQLFDALMRGWHLLPLGLYRRVHPGTGHRVNPQTAAALQLAAGPPALDGTFVFNRALVGYVYTTPRPDATLSEHDLVYVLLPELSVSAEGVNNHSVGASTGDDV